MGTRKIEKIVGSDEDTTVTTTTFAEVLCAFTQFADADFKDRSTYHGVWEPQQNLDNYIANDPDTGARSFMPNLDIQPLVRVFQCGSEGAFLQSAHDIFK